MKMTNLLLLIGILFFQHNHLWAQVASSPVDSVDFCQRDYLEKTIPRFEHKGVKNFYELTSLYLRPKLNHYIVETFAKDIQQKNPDFIAAPEARALPIMGGLAYSLEKPAIFIRKAGKLPGKTHRVDYKTAYSLDSLEIPDNQEHPEYDFKGKSVVIIDDGIASGGTMLAAIELMEKAGLNVVGIYTVIDHSYAKRDESYQKWESITKTLYDLGKKN